MQILRDAWDVSKVSLAGYVAWSGARAQSRSVAGRMRRIGSRCYIMFETAELLSGAAQGGA
jgi:hypothetical protein